MEDKEKKKQAGGNRKKHTIALIVCIAILGFLLLPSYIIAIGIGMPFPQVLFPPLGHNDLYGDEYRGYSSYKCTEMSIEVERFLESNGVHTYGVSGWKDGKNMTITVDNTTGVIDYDLDGGHGHRWLEIDFGWLTDLTGVTIPFDAQNMVICNPDWIMKYQVVTRDEGKYLGRQEIHYTQEDIEKIRLT